MRVSLQVLAVALPLLLAGCLERRPAIAPPPPPLRPIDPAIAPVSPPIVEPAAPPIGSSDAPPTAVAPPPGVAPGAAPGVPPAIAAAQARVKPILDRLLVNNQNLGLRPAVLITEQPEPIVHRREFERVFVSEGMVR